MKKETNIFQTRSLDAWPHTNQETTSNVCSHTCLSHLDGNCIRQDSQNTSSLLTFFIGGFPAATLGT